MPKANKYWAATIIVLLAVIIAGGAVIWSRYTPSQPIEISLPPHPDEIRITGAVNSPGSYPVSVHDTLGTIIQAAGGATSNADLNRLELSVPEGGNTHPPQKIDINRAEAWLLQALPGIGETRAQALIDYRNRNGPFHSTAELTKVQGIDTVTYEHIKDLITIAD